MTLEFWTLSLTPFESYIRERIAAFEAVHPGVRVEWVDVPYDAVERKLVAATAAGQSPDVVNMADLTFARFASLGAFRSLEGLQPTPAEERYLPGALGMCRIGGELLAVPWYLTTQAVLANTELLERGGISPDAIPDRWSELLEIAPAFRRRAGVPLFSHPLGNESQLPPMMLAEGLSPFVLDGDALRVSLDRSDIRVFLSRWADLFREGDVPREAATAGHAHLIDGYQRGGLALINTGPNFLGRIRDVARSVYDRTVVRPAVTGALGRTHISVMVLGVMRRSKHPELAAELTWFMTSPESQLAFCREVNILPSTPASLDDPLFTRLPSEDDPDSLIVQSRVMTARSLRDAAAFTPALAAWPDMRRVFEDRYTRVLLGSMQLDRAVNEVEREWNRLLIATGGGSLDAIPTPGPIQHPAADGAEG
ncbi:MAG: ABC transporter substrate-binding protein [Phycisphaerales bacterium]